MKLSFSTKWMENQFYDKDMEIYAKILDYELDKAMEIFSE